MTVNDISEKCRRGEKITMLTAYDFPLAQLIDQAGIDMILVGDSLANVVLGLESTTQVGMAEMIHHAKAVRRAVKNALVIGDMPFESYQVNPQEAVKNAKRFMDEAGCDAVKLEWFEKCLEVSEQIIKAKIPLMSHIGLTPQTADKIGGFKVQGRDASRGLELIKSALQLEKIGCFSIVLECVPDRVSKIITDKLQIPSIGIGAGPDCDGQVLVTHDMLGLFTRYTPKFVKKYVDLSANILEGVTKFKNEVIEAKFPDTPHSFTIKDEELERILKSVGKE